jgi:hypothetical protein
MATTVGTTMPTTEKEAKKLRANVKRTITNLLKEGKTLLSAKEGLPESEFRDTAGRLRHELGQLKVVSDWVIELKYISLDATLDDDQREIAETNIADTEQTYYDNVSDDAVPVTHDLLRRAEEIIIASKPPPPPVTLAPTMPTGKTTAPPSARMAKLKFPTFSGDLRDYKRFKEQFSYFSRDLPRTEQLYQLMESMEKSREKNKIKNCLSVGKAWDILDQEYGDEDRLVDTLITDLECVEPYHTKGNVNLASMSKFVETLQNFSTHFESLGMRGDLSGRVMLTQLRRKLPEDHHIAFLESVRDEKSENSITGLVSWLHSHLILLQKAKAPSVQNLPPNLHIPNL